MRARLVLVLAIALAVGGCIPGAPTLSAERASQIAVQTYAGQYTSGQKVSEVRVLTTVMGPSGQGGPGGIAAQGPDVWRVEVVGVITEPNGAHYESAAWIDVDPVTGVAHIVRQG